MFKFLLEKCNINFLRLENKLAAKKEIQIEMEIKRLNNIEEHKLDS
jgi:hypothetical protein